MKFWFFTEQQYHPGWDRVTGPIRNTPPTSLIDPVEAADLFDRYYEEFAALDELGINIALNEHHASFQSMSPTPYLSAAAIARTTKRARILSIGSPLGQRPDPVRLAEEIALADVLSRGRTELGMIKSIPWEYFNSNANPMGVMDRFWEAHDLIVKALTTRDGPFTWEGEYFHYRNVNIVPRPFQDPHPPIWITGQSQSSARMIAARGYVAVMSLGGTKGAASFFAAYRDEYLKAFGKPASNDRLAYLCYMAVGKTESEAAGIAERVRKWVQFLSSQNNDFQHAAGYAPAADYARLIRTASKTNEYMFPGIGSATIEDLREEGKMFWGTPDQVMKQLEAFWEKTGGVGNLMMQMGGSATQKDTIDCMTLVANELRPRIEALNARVREPALPA